MYSLCEQATFVLASDVYILVIENTYVMCFWSTCNVLLNYQLLQLCA